MIQCAFIICILLSLLNLHFRIVLAVNEEVEQALIKSDNIRSSIKSNGKNKSTFQANANDERVKNLKNSWFLNVPLLPVVVATSNSIPEGSCKKQLHLYLSHLNNGTLWATEMFDSSAKYPYGILEGLTRHLGIFDQCQRISVTIPSNGKNREENVQGRYCLVDIKYQEKNEPKNFTGPLDIWFDPHGSVWEAIREKNDIRRYERYRLEMALCVPASCHRKDILAALREPLDEFGEKYNLRVETSINKDLCHAAHEAPKTTQPTFIFCYILLLMIAFVVIGTICDDKTENPSFKKELLLCFSASRNLKSIFRINYRHRGLDSVHMMRFVLSTIAAVGHRHIQIVHVSNVTGRFFEMTMTSRIYSMIFHNGTIIVDGFFGFGGLVLGYQLLEYLEQSAKNFNFFLLILKRLIRLVPLYMFMTIAYAVLFHHLGSGPFWEHRFGFDRDSCTTYWWSNLLLISNYYNGRNTCVFQGWYITVDFHCFVIGIILILLFRKMSRKAGYTFLGIILMISIAIPFYATYKYEVESHIKGFGKVRRFEDYRYYTDYYIKTHMRLSAYFVGLIMGAFIHDFKSLHLSKAWSRILIILQVVVLSILIQNLGIYFVDPNVQTSSFVRALYASLHRPIFSFSMCSLALLLTIGDGLDFHYNFMTPGWVQPISKLSYGYYLTHFFIQSYDLGTARTAFTFSFFNFFRYAVIDSVYTLILALFLFILIEEPFNNLGNLLVKGKTSTKPIKESEITKKMD